MTRNTPGPDPWSEGSSYERYMGRWSREIAREFVALVAAPPGLAWADIGCGTGALTQTILDRCAPTSVAGIDQSAAFVDHARANITDPRADFFVGSAAELPCDTASVDVVASALAYNFFPDRPAALREFQRVARAGGTIAFYVWDYPGGGMGFIDAFWAAAVAVDPAANDRAEAARFPFCTRETLLREITAAGLAEPEVSALQVAARFSSFEDLWEPFTLGVGPAPAYVHSLGEEHRQAIRDRLNAALGDGPIELPLRAWAAVGRVT